MDPKTAPQGAPSTAPQGADDTPQDAAPQGDTAQPQGDAQSETPPAQDWQALARKWERQAKRDHDDLVALKKQMQGLLTPEQVQDQAQAAAAAADQATKATLEALRLRVALEKGIPAEFADRLIGATREELESDAATVLKFVAAQAPPPAARVPDAGAGTGRAPTSKPNLNDLLRAAAGVPT